MGQVTIYLDDEAEKKARTAAHSEGISLSKWIAERIRRNAKSEWPEAVRKLAGAWPDLADAEEIRGKEVKDLPRGKL